MIPLSRTVGAFDGQTLVLNAQRLLSFIRDFVERHLTAEALLVNGFEQAGPELAMNLDRGCD